MGFVCAAMNKGQGIGLMPSIVQDRTGMNLAPPRIDSHAGVSEWKRPWGTGFRAAMPSCIPRRALHVRERREKSFEEENAGCDRDEIVGYPVDEDRQQTKLVIEIHQVERPRHRAFHESDRCRGQRKQAHEKTNRKSDHQNFIAHRVVYRDERKLQAKEHKYPIEKGQGCREQQYRSCFSLSCSGCH